MKIGWRAAENFESGLAKTIRWYCENMAWWRSILEGGYRAQRIGLGDGASPSGAAASRARVVS